MLFSQLIIILSILSVLSYGTLITHHNELPRKRSDDSNIINLDLIDESAFDIHYETSCQQCKCILNTLPLNHLKQSEISLKTPVTQSFLISNKLFLLHKTATNEISYSIFEVSAPNVLKEIKTETSIPSSQRFTKIMFSPINKAFIGLADSLVFLNTIDDQGQLEQKTFSFNQDSNSAGVETYDMAYVNGFLFLAKGRFGIQMLRILDFSNSNLENKVLSIQDLELREGSLITRLIVENNILYAYDANSGSNFILALEFSQGGEITLLNKYETSIKNIIQIIPVSNSLYLIGQKDGKYYYQEFSAVTSDKYAKFDLTKFWELPVKVNSIKKNNRVVIDAENYLYIFRRDISYETERSELMVDIIIKESQSDFYQLSDQETTYLLAVDSLKLSLSLVKPRGKINLECGIFKQNYAGSIVPFTISVYKDSCSEAPNKEGTNICLDQFKFEVEFSGTDQNDFEVNPLVPVPLQISENNAEPIVADPIHPNPPSEPTSEEKPPVTESEGNQPDQPQQPDEPKESQPEEKHPTTETDDPSHPSGGGTTLPKNDGHSGEGDGGAGEKPTTPNHPDHPNGGDLNPIKKPVLVEPDVPYYDRINSGYALIIVAIIILTCLGCLAKCLYDFAKTSQDQYRHAQLPEEEEEEQENQNHALELQEKSPDQTEKNRHSSIDTSEEF